MCIKKIGRVFKNISFGLSVLVALFTLILHSISIWPAAKKVLWPNEKIEVIGFKSDQRIIIANTGNFDLFISHVHYGAPQFSYEKVAKELLSITQNIPIGDVKLNSLDIDIFDTNEDIGEIVQAGHIKKFEFENQIPENLSYVQGENDERWNRLVFIAGANKKSSKIRPVFFSLKDRRYLQINHNYQNNLNTFEGQGTVIAYSTRLNKEITFPFRILGTVTYDKEEEFKEKINKWLNPRPGHPEDLL